MSLSWRDRLRVVVGHDRLTLARTARGIGRSAESPAVIEFEPAGGWRAALDKLTDCVTEYQYRATDCDVVISNGFVRLLLVSPETAIETTEEALALARHRMDTVFGGDAQGLDLRCSFDGPGVAYIVSGIERDLIDGLRSILMVGPVRVRTIQPYLMPVVNGARRLVSRATAWVVVHEPGMVVIALLNGGRWMHLATHRVASSDYGWLPVLLEAETLRCGFDTPPEQVFLHTSADAGIEAAVVGKYQLTHLSSRNAIAPTSALPAPEVSPRVAGQGQRS